MRNDRAGLDGGALLALYSLVWKAARPILRRNRRLRDGFERRLVLDVRPEGAADGGTAGGTDGGTGVDVWMQAASGGEAYLARAILERLAARLAEDAPDAPEGGRPLRVLATSWTRQGLDVLEASAKAFEAAERPTLSVHADFFPFDDPSVMERALEKAAPKAVALLETELWPGLMLACARKGVPVLVLNGRMTEKSLLWYRRLELFREGFWKAVAPVRTAAVSLEDAARFAELFGEERVEAVSNVKFDRAAAASGGEAADPEIEGLFAGAGRTVLLASVRDEEEDAAERVALRLREGEETPPTIVVAPRHMHRVEPWLARLRGEGLEPLTRSGRKTPFPAGSVVVWDAFGELSRLYRSADAVFVGGSLAPLGGQNFLEPLALGKIPRCGPSLENFAWALQGTPEDPEDGLEARRLLLRLPDADAVAASLKAALAAPEDPDEVVERFRSWLSPRLGGAARCAEILLRTLNEKRL